MFGLYRPNFSMFHFSRPNIKCSTKFSTQLRYVSTFSTKIRYSLILSTFSTDIFLKICFFDPTLQFLLVCNLLLAVPCKENIGICLAQHDRHLWKL